LKAVKSKQNATLTHSTLKKETRNRQQAISSLKCSCGELEEEEDAATDVGKDGYVELLELMSPLLPARCRRSGPSSARALITGGLDDGESSVDAAISGRWSSFSSASSSSVRPEE
jgi:hypothetical protein